MTTFINLGLISFFSTVLAIGLSLKIFAKYNLLDKPRDYGLSRDAVPYSVGFALFFVFAILVLLTLNIDIKVVLILIAGFILVTVSFFDDHLKLSPFLRLAIQFICASIVVFSGARVLEVSNPFGDPIQLGFWGFFISVFWIMLLTNLMNFLDGVPALSSGVSSVGFFVIFALSVMPQNLTDQTIVSYMSIILGFLCLAATIFEFPSPKILVGDSGAMFYGFMLGVLSLINGGKLATAGLVLLIPIFDGLWTISRRIFAKKSPFLGDRLHFHHRLLKAGVSEKRLLFSYYFASVIFGLIAIYSWNTIFKIISLVILFSGLSLIAYYLWIREKK